MPLLPEWDWPISIMMGSSSHLSALTDFIIKHLLEYVWKAGMSSRKILILKAAGITDFLIYKCDSLNNTLINDN